MAAAAPYKWSGNIVDKLDINPRIIMSAKRAGYVSILNILRASQSELQQKLGLAAADVEQLISAVAAYALPRQLSGWEIDNSNTGKLLHITSGCRLLDDFLGGGIPVRGITEVAGESGSGKTQLALQLSLHVQLSPSSGGLGKGVAYICTESQFPAARLQQLIKHMQRNHPKGPKSYSDNIFIHHVPDMDSLVDCVRYQLPHLVPSRQVGLVVIDSVAAAFRAEDGTDLNKTTALQTLGYRLHQLASSHKIAVLAINQVTATMGKQDLYGLTASITPALGLSWSNLVTTRLMLTRSSSFVNARQILPKDEEDKGSGWDIVRFNNSLECNEEDAKKAVEYNVRVLEVVFCPWLERKSCSFVVTEKGIENIVINTEDLCVSSV
nr:DNA repair protein XRCC3-like [Procambarus clarkii]XP_045623945.1 DNA repair protein XRCC3-like [Procambarus clarkii]XP_045623955.1 DNA repair protein XRCC3-like [Procambarus clarkii]